MSEDRLYGIAEVAEKLGVSHFTVRRLVKNGSVKSVQIGDRRLIPAYELQRLLLHGSSPAARAVLIAAA